MSPAQKVVHVIGQLGWFDHAEQMRALAIHQRDAGLHVEIVAFAGQARDCRALAAEGLPCRIVRRRWSSDPFAAHQLSQWIGKLQPQAIHCWAAETADYAAILRWAAPRSRIIATLEKPLSERLFWLPGSLTALNAVVTDVPHFGDRAEVEQARLAARVKLIPPGVSTQRDSSVTRTQLCAQLGIPPDAQLLVTAGRLIRAQRLDEALWNYELVRTLQEGACLLIVGAGPDQARLQRYARLVTDPAAVRFLHPRDWYSAAIAHADVYWQPGESRTIPTGLLQALSHGVPTVANDTPTHRAVITSGDNGLLAPTDNRALWTRYTSQLLSEESQRAPLSEAASRTIEEKYSQATMLESYGRMYQLTPNTSAA